MIWKSGDRKTVWTKTYSQTYLDGRVCNWIVEKIVTLDKLHKFQKTDFTMKVVPVSVQLYNSRTMELAPNHHEYYTFSQSFHGGPDAKSDALDGFCTGQYSENYSETTNTKFLIDEGFILEKDTEKYV